MSLAKIYSEKKKITKDVRVYDKSLILNHFKCFRNRNPARQTGELIDGPSVKALEKIRSRMKAEWFISKLPFPRGLHAETLQVDLENEFHCEMLVTACENAILATVICSLTLGSEA